jgi:peroxiredoxin
LKAKILIALFIFTCHLQISSQNKTVAPVTVFVFLSESCPICQSYTLPLKTLYKKYHQQVEFVGVFPNEGVSAADLQAFKTTYAIPFRLMTDSGNVLTKKFHATVTPEVFVQNAKEELIYSGRIDNSFYAVGKRRKLVTTHELEDALSQYTSGHDIAVPKTQAVGCIITE